MQITIDKTAKTAEKIPQEWIEYKDGFELLIAGDARPSYQYAHQLMIAEENAKRTQGDITDDYVRNLDQKYSGVIGRYLILGWRGTDLEYSVAQAELLCKFGKTADDDNFGSKIALWVQKQASKIQKRADKAKLDAVGKQQSSTNGQKNMQASRSTKKDKE